MKSLVLYHTVCGQSCFQRFFASWILRESRCVLRGGGEGIIFVTRDKRLGGAWQNKEMPLNTNGLFHKYKQVWVWFVIWTRNGKSSRRTNSQNPEISEKMPFIMVWEPSNCSVDSHLPPPYRWQTWESHFPLLLFFHTFSLCLVHSPRVSIILVKLLLPLSSTVAKGGAMIEVLSESFWTVFLHYGVITPTDHWTQSRTP